MKSTAPNGHRTHLLRPRFIGILALTSLTLCGLGASVAATDDPVLVSVNGEPITASDLDRVIMQMHSSADMSDSDNSAIERYFNKAINDRLILQEARAMELHRDPQILAEVQQDTEKQAVRIFTRENFEPPLEPTEQEIRERFEELFWKVELRRLSVRTRAEADQLAFMIREGVPMDSLARELSLDTNKLSGGKIGPLFWADVQEELRAQVRGVDENVLVGPFPYRETFALVRVEARHEPDFDDLESARGDIVVQLRGMAREKAWDDFVQTYWNQTPPQRDAMVLGEIDADSSKVYLGDFLVRDPRPAVWVGNRLRSGGEVRRAISRTAMEMGTSAWSEIREVALTEIEEQLVLAHQAEEAGIFERPQVVESEEQRLDELLVNVYLNQTVVPEVVFNREDFDQFYQENLDQFRGPQEVRLDVMVFDDRDTADEARALLAQGASFDFVREKFLGIEASDVGKTKWANSSLFSAEVQRGLQQTKVNGFTPVLSSSTRWMIMELEGRREGQVRPLDEVELQIRQVMFQREFNELLGERLELLKERSEIVRHEDEILEYFRPEAEVEDAATDDRPGETDS